MNSAQQIAPKSIYERACALVSLASHTVKGYWESVDHKVSVLAHDTCNYHLAHVIERLFRAAPITACVLLSPFPLSVASFTAFSILNTFVEPKPFLDETVSFIHDGVSMYTMIHAVKNISIFATNFQNYYLVAALIWTAATSILFGKPMRDTMHAHERCPVCLEIRAKQESTIINKETRL